MPSRRLDLARPIFLTGMMGSGKSTIGPELAESLGCAFIDLDQRIERIYGRSIPEIFEDGEPAFRACERGALRSLAAEPGFEGGPCVVATGGGVVVDPENLALMSSCGASLYLRVPAAVLVARLSAKERAGRPLLAHEDEALADRLERLLLDRSASYEACDFSVDADTAPARVVQRIRELESQS